MLTRLFLLAALVSGCTATYPTASQDITRSSLLPDVTTVAALPEPTPTTPGYDQPQDRPRPASPHARLAATISICRDIAVQGGWGPVRAGEALRLGSESPRVVVLRAHLSMTADLKGDSERAEIFDVDLAAAVRAFQARHGLQPDGETLQVQALPNSMELYGD